jgi:hypothetical protein
LSFKIIMILLLTERNRTNHTLNIQEKLRILFKGHFSEV